MPDLLLIGNKLEGGLDRNIYVQIPAPLGGKNIYIYTGWAGHRPVLDRGGSSLDLSRDELAACTWPIPDFVLI